MTHAAQEQAPGTVDLPRNLVALREKAEAIGWAATVEGAGTSRVELTLTARVAYQDSTAEAVIRCAWRATAQGAYRWDGATMHRDGHAAGTGIGWREVGPLVDSAQPVMVHPEKEASGETHRGRTAQAWRQQTSRQAKGASDASLRASDALGGIRKRMPGLLPISLTGERLSDTERAARALIAPAWIDAADAKMQEQFRRLHRRLSAVTSVLLRLARETERRELSGAAPDARRAFELYRRAQALASACVRDADAIEAAALATEAEACCAPYVDDGIAQMYREEAQWREENPDGDARAFAQAVIRAINGADARFAEWWQDNARPGMTFFEGWDAMHRGHMTEAETRASLRLNGDKNRALFALGAAASGHLARTAFLGNEKAHAAQLADAAQRGGALYAPGARRRFGEADRLAGEVWRLLCGDPRPWGGLSLDLSKDLAALDAWEIQGADEEVTEAAEQVRRMLLIRHGLMLRQEAHAAERERLKEEEAERARTARAAYDAARRAGQSEEEAREAAGDVRARAEAQAAGEPAGIRDRFQRGDAVWVAPAADTVAPRYVAEVVGYTRNERFRVRELAYGTTVDVHAGRLESATAEEAAGDRARQQAERQEREAEQARQSAKAREEREQWEKRFQEREERRRAREEAARGTEPPTATDGAWEPEFPVPASLGELWSAAARNGWAMDRCTRGSKYTSALVVRIVGTTDKGRWLFRLVWTVHRGRYAVNKQASGARWADGRSGPRGGEIRPTVRDVLGVMIQETQEGAAAPLGELVRAGVPSAERSAPVSA